MKRAVAVLFLALLSTCSFAQAPAIERTPILFDTDIGTNIDDPFALALILASPELELRGGTTVSGNTQQRAMMLCRFFTMTGRRHTSVAVGADPQPARIIGSQYQYYYHPDVLFNRTTKPVKESAVEFLHARLKAQPGKVTILACGPLTNVARLLKEKPDSKELIKQIVWSGGAFADAKMAEPNAAADPTAVKTVLGSGVPLVIVPANVTDGKRLSAEDVKRIFAPKTALSLQVECLFQLWDQEKPPLADVIATALCVTDRFVTLKESRVEVNDQGRTTMAEGKANARVVTEVREKEFVSWYVERMANCVRPGDRPAKFVPQGGMPNRVHVAEDYDNDIERRWWMAGKAETKNLPAGSLRACRGVLTHDFDDLLGDPKAMWTAVVFNPVPGPPMGKNPRLSFRYWVKGTDRIRVQLYSLSNGYHRHLVVADLPQEKWQHGTVDMTMARRPDGTGGPLSEGERIDDIQFYVDPRAELIIDDVFLYDAAAAGEKRPFPKRVFFTGLFDSGKQGKEWPGTFDIAPQKGFFWNAAKSVENAETKTPWIRLHLRGERTLGDVTHLTFRYKITGAAEMNVALVNRTAKEQQRVRLKGMRQDEWAEATIDFSRDTEPRKPAKGDKVDEILFLLPAGAELLIDDLLLFEPGS
jgi:inosine-uridine nucleoside N-ribohydrolase